MRIRGAEAVPTVVVGSPEPWMDQLPSLVDGVFSRLPDALGAAGIRADLVTALG